MMMADKEKEYQRICEKLGFIPSEYEYDGPLTEDDTWVNPFSVLTIEESDFLWENGYLNKQQIPPVRNARFTICSEDSIISG